MAKYIPNAISENPDTMDISRKYRVDKKRLNELASSAREESQQNMPANIAIL